MFIVLLSWQSHCQSSPYKCRTMPSSSWPSHQANWPVCCYRLYSPLPYSITQPKSW